GVVDATPLDLRAGRARAQPFEAGESLLELVALADDADELLHRVLQLGVYRVRVFTAAALEGSREPLRVRAELRVVHARRGSALAVLGRGLTGTLAEHQEVRERVPAEPVRAVHACRD